MLALEVQQTDIPHAVNQTDCGRDAGGACVQFANNGTGTFGGSYADGLILGHSYHFNIQFTEPNGTLPGNSSSSSFTMINPVVGSVSQTTSASSTKVTSTSAASRSSSTMTQSATASATPATNPPSSGLSTGAKAGIAVGATLAGLLFLLGVFFLWRRLNRSGQMQDGQMTQSGPSELEGKRLTAGYYGGELPADEPAKKPQELDSNPTASLNVSKEKSAASATHLMPPAVGASLAGDSDASTGASTFIGGQRVSEDMTPEQLAQLEEEERRIDEAIRESEAQKKAVEARIKQARGGAGSSS